MIHNRITTLTLRIRRRGAILPLFAFLLPVLLILCGLAINTAHMRLVKTEMKIATDAAVHASGRAMSINQSTASAILYAKNVAAMNTVNGNPLIISDDNLVGFGFSSRASSGYGRYSYSAVTRAEVDNQSRQANSISLTGQLNMPLMFRGIPNVNSVNIQTYSIATQVDRDIALVLDRSGSMYWFESQATWDYVFNDMRTRGRISSTERDNAKNGIWNSHAYASSSYINTNTWNKLSADWNRDASYTAVYKFVFDWRNVTNKAPRHSRWDLLNSGVTRFLDVLDGTDQEELLSLATFSSSSWLNYSLTLDYSPIRTYVAGIVPNGATAIGKGIQTAIPSIMTASNARPYAAKTIVVLTDGENNSSPEPDDVARAMVAQYNITLHTVTFTSGGDQAAMEEVAQIGGGKHYHAETGTELIEIFEEIANNLPTILTQ